MTTTQKTADAIVVVNPKGIAVDSNNAFAQMCGVPAGLIVGRPLERFAPELARELEVIAEACAEPAAVLTPAGEFGVDVRPLAVRDNDGGKAAEIDSGAPGATDRVVRLRASGLDRTS